MLLQARWWRKESLGKRRRWYLPDYIGPCRSFPGVEELRRLAFSDLDGALQLGLEMTLEHLKDLGDRVSPASREALAFIRSQRV